jgi:hypothetical protein
MQSHKFERNIICSEEKFIVGQRWRRKIPSQANKTISKSKLSIINNNHNEESALHETQLSNDKHMKILTTGNFPIK